MYGASATMRAEARLMPLATACDRVRAELPDFVDHALDPDRTAEVSRHLEACVGCATRHAELREALGALSLLTADDLAQLQAELPPAHTSSPGTSTHWAFSLSAAALVLLTAGAVLFLRDPEPVTAPPSEPPAVVAAATTATLPLPVVGGSLGFEDDPNYVSAALAPPVPAPQAPAPAPVPDLPDLILPPVAPAPVDPTPPAPVPVPVAPAPAAPAPDPAATPLPVAAQDVLGRLQLSNNGLRYREVILYFIRDPEARDTLSRDRTPDTWDVRELRLPDPARVEVRLSSSGLVLSGTLLDGPLGLRLNERTHYVRGRTEVEGVPVSFEPATRSQRAPLLRGPTLLPSRARLALVTDAVPAANTVLIESLNDSSLLQFRRLRDELARLESEARELERRLVALARRTRGLRGIAITINGVPRSLELFGSSRLLSRNLLCVLRTALLEAVLENDVADQRVLGDPRPTTVVEVQHASRAAHQAFLLRVATATLDATTTDLYRFDAGSAAGEVYLEGDDDLLHAFAIAH